MPLGSLKVLRRLARSLKVMDEDSNLILPVPGVELHMQFKKDPSAYSLDKGVESTPPSSKCKIVNIYVDPSINKLVIQYDDTPQP